MDTIGFGGSCHWCTEAIFQSLKGVQDVKQGWILSDYFSEAVVVSFDPEIISAATLIAVHLHTHRCTSRHSMREKYRSAVYVFDEEQALFSKQTIQELQSEFDSAIITEVLPFKEFKWNKPEQLNYYYTDPNRPFCRSFIDPKLKSLMLRFGKEMK